MVFLRTDSVITLMIKVSVDLNSIFLISGSLLNENKITLATKFDTKFSTIKLISKQLYSEKQ